MAKRKEKGKREKSCVLARCFKPKERSKAMEEREREKRELSRGTFDLTAKEEDDFYYGVFLSIEQNDDVFFFIIAKRGKSENKILNRDQSEVFI